jgi:hypothetical protein
MTESAARFRLTAPQAERGIKAGQFFRALDTNKVTDFSTSNTFAWKEKIDDFILELSQPSGQNLNSIFYLLFIPPAVSY